MKHRGRKASSRTGASLAPTVDGSPFWSPGHRQHTDFWQSPAMTTFYSETTEPMLARITEPIPVSALPRRSWISRMTHAIGAFFAAIINKINQLLAFALAVVLLLLFTRFILHFFGLSSSLFSSWVFLLSRPLVEPFVNLLPALPYNGYSIDVSTLIAIIVYALVVTLVRQFLKLLVARPM